MYCTFIHGTNTLGHNTLSSPHQYQKHKHHTTNERHTMDTNPKRDPVKEELLCKLQWGGHYWGPLGAIAQAEQYYSQFSNEEPQARLWAHMSLASVYYSAASSAATIARHIKMQSRFNVCAIVWNAYGMIKWAWTSYSLLKKAWQLAQAANFLVYRVEGLQASSSDYDVMQSIARKYYRTLWWDKPHGYKAKVVLGLAIHSIETALKMSDCTDISRCLLLTGHTDLLWLQIEPHNQGKLRIAVFDILLEVWDIAMKIALTETDQQTKRQLSRVFRHIKEMSERLIPFQKEVMLPQHQLYPSSAAEMKRQANQLLLQYLGMSASLDQVLKADLTLPLPSQPIPPPDRPTT